MALFNRTRRRLSVVFVVAMMAALLPAVPTLGSDDCGRTTIMAVQGKGHISPCVGEEVTVEGIVTAVAFNGYYLQDPLGDGDPETSDGIFVFQTSNLPAVGDHLRVTDTVSEFIPGGAATGNLSITQLSFPETTLLSSGNPLPAAQVIGTSGRIPPAVDVISESELPVNLQNVPGVFNPDNDGIDFYESVEGMLVTVEDPVAVSATRTFSPFSSEMWVLPNDGAHVAPADARTGRGGINLQPHPENRGDQNPERVQIQFDGTLYPAAVPAITVGDHLSDVTGVVGYSFGNFEVNATSAVTVTDGGLGGEISWLVGDTRRATIASYNVLNLSPLASDDNQRAALADQIVKNLRQPDILALQEIQDNNGTIDDGTTDASETLQALVDAIVAAGGPEYVAFDVAPADGSSGGVPGGNIRNAFLYNPDRVYLVDYVSLTPDVLDDMGVSNPDAFDGTRDPLMATFKFRGRKVTIINNHLTSRFGSTPVFGGPQPFVQAGEAERGQETATLNEVVDHLMSGDGKRKNPSNDRIMVLGDLNTMEFTNEMTETLPGTGHDRVLWNKIDTLAHNVYTFNFEGNSQVLDHIFVTDHIARKSQFDIVHVNVDFPRVDDTVASDHEPLLIRTPLARQQPRFTLTVLHNNDGESALLPDGDEAGVARFKTVLDNERVGTVGKRKGAIMVSSGDNFLAGPEFNASLNDGIWYDAIALDSFNYDAIALGNHDFDFGPDLLADFIGTGFSNPGDPPYLSANLDFSGEPGLQALVDSDVIAASTIVETSGVKVGIIGATTENLPFISSPRDVVVNAVLPAVQAEVAELEGKGIKHIVFISHLQDIEGDIALAEELSGVDVMVAGGGDELLANPSDLLLPSDSPDDIFGPYPMIAFDDDARAVPVVTTSGSYGYLGKLVVDFDRHGNVLTWSGGPVRVVGDAFPDGVAPDPALQAAVVDPVADYVADLATNVLATSEVDLDGIRENVRSMETNEGNLIADSQLWQAQQLAASFGVPEPDVALQNGGGIRNDNIIPAGDITELDTFSMVPFGNFVTVVPDIPRSQFKEIMENAVSRTQVGDEPGGTGRFAQVAGFTFEYSATGTAQVLNDDGTVAVPGTRIQSLVLDDGTVIVAGGAVVPGDDVHIAITDFLARGGDQYPFRGAPFTALGVSYQQALANYLQAATGDGGLGGLISAAQYPFGGEGRITELP